MSNVRRKKYYPSNVKIIHYSPPPWREIIVEQPLMMNITTFVSIHNILHITDFLFSEIL